MSHKTLIFSVILFYVFCSTNLFSAQYENYKWGISKKEAIQQVKDNGYSILEYINFEKVGEESIAYYDKIFGYKVRVHLKFSPKSNKLYAILIESVGDQSRYLGSKLLQMLQDKYGKASYLNQYENNYYWLENGKVSIILVYNFKTELIYYSIYYSPIADKEYEELYNKEAKGKL